VIRFLSAGAIVRLAVLLLVLGLAPDPAGAQPHGDATSAGPATGPSSDPPSSAANTNASAANGATQTSVVTGGNSISAASSNPIAGSPIPPRVSPPIDFASGQTVSTSEQTTFLAMTRFTQTLLDPFVGGRGAGTTVQSEAVDDEAIANAYAAMSGKAPLASGPYASHWSVWTSGIGASLTGNGNTMPGSGATSRQQRGTSFRLCAYDGLRRDEMVERVVRSCDIRRRILRHDAVVYRQSRGAICVVGLAIPACNDT
jgi:hypothetical protein